MKSITKDNKGITLIALIITIIIMLILTSVTIYTGLDTYKFSKVNAFVTEMQLIQSKVDEKTVDELLQLGTKVTSTTTINLAFSNNEISSNDTSAYRYFTKEILLDKFDIEDVSSDVMINIATREVVSARGVEYNGNKYYTQYKLPGGQTVINNDSSISRELEFSVNTSIDGLNCSLTISNVSINNGILKFAEIDSEGNIINNWQTITNYTEKENTYSANISKSGIYLINLQDNTNQDNYIEKTIAITLTNKPKTNLSLSYNYGASSDIWAYAQKDSVNYVWIPRFAYDINNNIKFIKGNSNIATDNTYINNNWNIHNKFISSEGIELTGIWISVSLDEVNQSGLDMITLLGANNRTTLIEI